MVFLERESELEDTVADIPWAGSATQRNALDGPRTSRWRGADELA